MEDLAFQLVAAIDFGGLFTKILNVLSVALGLGLVIFFHELGHFAVAKWCNVHVERFSIGIGPILWSRQKGETEYALSALPFGGYVKMLGQDDMDPNQMTSSEIAENTRSYSAKSVPQRMAIISARTEMAISSGVIAPRSKPAGALKAERRFSPMPSSARSARKAAALRRDPTKAT